MAAVDLMVKGVQVKRRGPLVTWLLIIITFGIYSLFHWYYMNREVRDFSAAMGQPLGNAPGRSVLALFPGGLIIVPAIWTWVTTAKRVRAVRAMVLNNGPGEYPSVGLSVLLSFLYSLQHPYLQVSLNGTWDLAGGTSATLVPPVPPAAPPAE